MTPKNIWWWVGGAIAIVLLVVGAGLVFHPTSAPTVSQNISTASSSPVTVVTKKIEQTDDISRVDVSYPFITGISQDINNQIQALLQNRIADFKKIAHENEQARVETNARLPLSQQRPARPNPNDFWYELNITYATGTIDAKTASILFLVDEYSGGAHGNKSFIPFNYDIANNKPITLADVFLNVPDYLQKISDFVYADVLKQLTNQETGMQPDIEWVKAGTAPQTDNFSAFTINNNSITFYIPPYQVAPYALGDFQVEMPIPPER